MEQESVPITAVVLRAIRSSVVPLCFVAASLLIAGHVLVLRPGEALWSLGTVLVGVPLYVIFGRLARRAPERERVRDAARKGEAA